MNVTTKRPPVRVATFQDKTHPQPPKLATPDCCPECRGPQSSYTSAPHGNLNTSIGAPLSFSGVNPPVNPPVKPPVFVDVHTDIESSKDKSKDNCCLIS